MNKAFIVIVGAAAGVAVTRIERKTDPTTHGVIGAVVGLSMAALAIKAGVIKIDGGNR